MTPHATTELPINAAAAPEDTMDAADCAALLRMHVVTIRLKAASGEIPGRQIGNRWRFSRAVIMDWLAHGA
jgi:excisionase family DNA binding protein